MTDFDPEAYIAANKPHDDFDPEAYIAANQPPKPKTSLGMSALRGAAQGASFGWIDEASAAIGAAKDALTSNVDYSTAYKAWKDAIRGADKKAQEDNPWTYGLSQVGGGVLASLVPGAKALNVTNYATVPGRIAAAGGVGALGAAGASTASPTSSFDDAARFVGDVVTGGAIGAGTQGAFEALSPLAKKAAEKVPEWLSSTAEKRAVKAAVGNQQKVMDTLKATGQTNKVGRDLLDSRVVSFGSSAKSISRAAGAEKEAIGKRIGDLVAQIDEASPNMVDGKKIASEIADYAASIDSPNNKAVVENLMKQAGQFEEMGSISLKEAQRLKNQYQWKFGESPSLTREATNKLKGIIGDEMEQAVGKFDALASAKAEQAAAESVKTGTGSIIAAPSKASKVSQAVDQAGEGLTAKERSLLADAIEQEMSAAKEAPASALGEYQALKGKYGSMSTAKSAATKLSVRQDKNRTFSLTDYIAGGVVGGSTMSPLKGLAAAQANKVIRERGSSMAAVSLDALANALSGSPKVLEKYLPILNQAANTGGNSLYGTHLYLLSTDPDYRTAIDKAEKQAAIERRLGGK